MKVHVYLHDRRTDSDEVVESLKAIGAFLAGIKQTFNEHGAAMADVNAAVQGLTDAVAAMTTRIDEDVQHLRDLVDQALATQTADQAEIARLQGEADAAVTSINDATSRVGAIDPVSDFPSTPEPTPTPEPEPPADTSGAPAVEPGTPGTNDNP